MLRSLASFSLFGLLSVVAQLADPRSAFGQTDDEWARRALDVSESNTQSGGVGLLRTQHAESGAPGQFRIGFVAEGLSASFLCTPQFPCPNPNPTPGQPPVTSDTVNHSGGTLSLGISVAKIGAGTLEGYATTSGLATSDAVNRPSFLEVLGDSDLGVKYAAPLGDVMRLGLFTELWLVNGIGSVGLDGNGTSAKFGGIVTADLRGTSARVPLRFSLNGVYALDNSADVVAATEASRAATFNVPGGLQPITRIERYGLGINRVDHIDLLLGGEALLVDERVRPFVEAHVLIANNRQGYHCIQDQSGNPTNPSHDLCMRHDAVVPSTLTIGSRFFPWKRGFSLLAAVDVGLTGTANFVEELQPVPPWTLLLGAGWAADTWDRPPAVQRVQVEKVVEGPKPVRLVGFVHEAGKNEPVVGATLSFREHSELWPLATGPDGKFGADLQPGAYALDVKADGFKPATCEANATSSAPGTELDVDCPLDPLPRVGSIVGHVHDAETNAPVAGVQVVVTDSQRNELRMGSDPTGAFHFEGVAPGTAQVSVVAEGYLAFVVPLDIRARQESSIDPQLRAMPKQPRVRVTGKELTIKEQVQFELDSAVILPQSFGLLTEVADTLIRHTEIGRLEVQGHTDSSGTPEHNKILSEDRAAAVRSWLIQHGVAADRLTAKGYGQENPLVPNVTSGNRARNRRVQFIIVDKSAPAPAGPGSP